MNTALQPRFTELRTGAPSDLQSVAALMAESFDPRFGEAWSSAQCLGMLALPGVRLTLALQDDDLAGFALARVIAGDGELLLLAVRPRLRGRGVGAALLRDVIADAVDRRAERLHLEVRSSNPAIALYRRYGFEQVGERRGYYRGSRGESFDALTFARAIAA